MIFFRLLKLNLHLKGNNFGIVGEIKVNTAVKPKALISEQFLGAVLKNAKIARDNLERVLSVEENFSKEISLKYVYYNLCAFINN